MTTEDNMTTIRRICEEAFNKGNLDVIDEVYSANYVYHGPRPPVSDREGFKQGLAAIRVALPDLRITLEDIFASGDKVAFRYTVRGTHQGVFMGVPPTGNSITYTGIVISRLDGGQMVEDWEWSDELGWLQQLGLVSLPQ